MRKEITIVAEPRVGRGKNEARRLRVAGRIPAIVYGAGKESTAVAVDPQQINRILFSETGHNTIFNVSIEGQDAAPAMVVAWQHDPVKDTLLHVDLERIRLDKKLQVKVPVHTLGEAIGVKTQGGLLESVHREVMIECLPDDIPAHIEVDIAHLEIGETLRASQLSLPDAVELLSRPEIVICHVVELRAAEATSEEGEEEAEVEEDAATEEKKKE